MRLPYVSRAETNEQQPSKQQYLSQLMDLEAMTDIIFKNRERKDSYQFQICC